MLSPPWSLPEVGETDFTSRFLACKTDHVSDESGDPKDLLGCIIFSVSSVLLVSMSWLLSISTLLLDLTKLLKFSLSVLVIPSKADFAIAALGEHAFLDMSGVVLD